MDFEEGINEIEADFLTDKEIETGHEIVPMEDEVIFLVHLTPELVEEQPDGTPYKAIIESFISFLKSKIISRASDKVGLIFFGSVR